MREPWLLSSEVVNRASTGREDLNMRHRWVETIGSNKSTIYLSHDEGNGVPPPFATPEQAGIPHLSPDTHGNPTPRVDPWAALRHNADQARSAPRHSFTSAAAFLAVTLAAATASRAQATA
eukprot:10569517-Heterocapsa_arctica.AAC.1